MTRGNLSDLLCSQRIFILTQKKCSTVLQHLSTDFKINFPLSTMLAVDSSRLTTVLHVHTHTPTHTRPHSHTVTPTACAHYSFPLSSSWTVLICYSLRFLLNTLTQKHHSPDKFHVSFTSVAICHCPALAAAWQAETAATA